MKGVIERTIGCFGNRGQPVEIVTLISDFGICGVVQLKVGEHIGIGAILPEFKIIVTYERSDNSFPHLTFSPISINAISLSYKDTDDKWIPI